MCFGASFRPQIASYSSCCTRNSSEMQLWSNAAIRWDSAAARKVATRSGNHVCWWARGQTTPYTHRQWSTKAGVRGEGRGCVGAQRRSLQTTLNIAAAAAAAAATEGQSILGCTTWLQRAMMTTVINQLTVNVVSLQLITRFADILL